MNSGRLSEISLSSRSPEERAEADGGEAVESVISEEVTPEVVVKQVVVAVDSVVSEESSVGASVVVVVVVVVVEEAVVLPRYWSRNFPARPYSSSSLPSNNNNNNNNNDDDRRRMRYYIEYQIILTRAVRVCVQKGSQRDTLPPVLTDKHLLLQLA